MEVYATLDSGVEQHFSGRYDLRRANVDGDGAFRLHGASLAPVAP
ncbi:MAG: hypothetical protein R3F59_11765 [Myxococcota bacterium]